ncbi:MAG: response regulator transcription factor [Maribacter sp.]|nr:response regulator transcription factor [Maribacter sp.]
MKSDILRIIVIDNQPSFHEMYTSYFETYEDYALTGIYVSIEEAIADFDHARPHIIVSEVSIPDIFGVKGIKLFRGMDPEVKIIMISEMSDFEVVKKAFKNGANGYLTKPVGRKRMNHALNSIQYEGAIMSNDIAKKVISMFRKKRYTTFSERENQIIDYLCRGATYKIIADKLFVTTSTINFHIQNIYLKLNVNSKSEALLKLQELE